MRSHKLIENNFCFYFSDNLFVLLKGSDKYILQMMSSEFLYEFETPKYEHSKNIYV